MKIKAFFLAAALMAGATAQAQSLGDLLQGLGGGGNGSDLGSTIGNVLSGIFTKTDLTLEDLVGEYVSQGPAVTFKSDNFLQKAGGIAGAAALETKLQPYYEQYGLTGMPMTIDADGNFTMTVKMLKLSGNVVPGSEQGTFTFNVLALGKIKVGQFTAYVQKSGQNMDLMFDATKLKEMISTIGKVSGMSIAQTLGTLLDSYDGACIGFSMQYTGAPSSTGTTTSGSGLDALFGGSRSNGSTQTQDSTTTPAAGEGLNNLLNILNKKK
jgi:hypothetical protein